MYLGTLNKIEDFFSSNFCSLLGYLNFKDGRDVSAGATGATGVAPKFSDTLTLSQLGGGEGRFCPPLQMSQLIFFRGYAAEPNDVILTQSHSLSHTSLAPRKQPR